MATPPRITRAELEAAVARIHTRHDRVDDPRRSEMGTDPRDVLDHFTQQSAGLPRWVAAADVADALVLATWCWWEDRRRERALLRRGQHLGLTLAELGSPLGVTTRQGLRDRLDRLDALLEFDHPDEQLTRTARRSAATGDARQCWIDAHRDEVCDVLSGLLHHVDRCLGRAPYSADPADDLDDDGWLGELRADLDSDAITAATLAILGLASTELRSSPTVASLDHHHGLHRALVRADRLRSRFAEVTTTSRQT